MEPLVFNYFIPEFNKTIYLDKDGVLNTAIAREGKLSSPQKFDEINIKEDLEDILFYSKKKYNLVIISNQPDLDRKIITKNFLLENINQIREQLPISVVIVCPHIKEKNCLCRKPETGMIKKFRDLFPRSVEKELLIGDQITDEECAKRLQIPFIRVTNPFAKKNNINLTF